MAIDRVAGGAAFGSVIVPAMQTPRVDTSPEAADSAIRNFTEHYRRITASPLPEAIADSARMALVDWFAVGLAGMADREARALAETVHQWQSVGRAPVLDGRRAAPAAAALINGAAAHTLDFDDFHIASLLHPGAPTFAAVLALGYHRQVSGAQMLAAFVCGVEIGARSGLDGVGETLAARGWHPTSVLGHLSAAAAAAALFQFDEHRFARALCLAAAQAGGLMGAAGSFAKPFAVGKAAMNGVIAAELAASGASAPAGLLDDGDRGLFGSMLQQHKPTPQTPDPRWLTLDNTFKPYPSCQLTHAAYEAGLLAYPSLSDRIPRVVTLTVHPLAPVIACHHTPRSILQARFSLPYCVALGLQGRRAVLSEFSDEGLADSRSGELARCIQVKTDASVARWSARIRVEFTEGDVFQAEVPAALGSLDRPMSWPDIEAKFIDTVEPINGPSARPLLEALRRFDSPGAADEVAALLSRLHP